MNSFLHRGLSSIIPIFVVSKICILFFHVLIEGRITQKSGNSNFEDTRKYIRMEWYLSFNRCPIGAVTRAAEPAGFELARKREVCDAGDTCS